MAGNTLSVPGWRKLQAELHRAADVVANKGLGLHALCRSEGDVAYRGIRDLGVLGVAVVASGGSGGAGSSPCTIHPSATPHPPSPPGLRMAPPTAHPVTPLAPHPCMMFCPTPCAPWTPVLPPPFFRGPVPWCAPPGKCWLSPVGCPLPCGVLSQPHTPPSALPLRVMVARCLGVPPLLSRCWHPLGTWLCRAAPAVWSFSASWPRVLRSSSPRHVAIPPLNGSL